MTPGRTTSNLPLSRPLGKKRIDMLRLLIEWPLRLAIVYTGLFLVLFNGYVWLLTSANHTSVNLDRLTSSFHLLSAFSALLLIFAWAFDARWLRRWLAWMLLVLSTVAIVNVRWYQETDIMMRYEVWLAKGMPGRTATWRLDSDAPSGS